jgi:hypothetical protein
MLYTSNVQGGVGKFKYSGIPGMIQVLGIIASIIPIHVGMQDWQQLGRLESIIATAISGSLFYSLNPPAICEHPYPTLAESLATGGSVLQHYH